MGSEWIRGNGSCSSAANTKVAKSIRRFYSSFVSRSMMSNGEILETENYEAREMLVPL